MQKGHKTHIYSMYGGISGQGTHGTVCSAVRLASLINLIVDRKRVVHEPDEDGGVFSVVYEVPVVVVAEVAFRTLQTLLFGLLIVILVMAACLIKHDCIHALFAVVDCDGLGSLPGVGVSDQACFESVREPCVGVEFCDFVPGGVVLSDDEDGSVLSEAAEFAEDFGEVVFGLLPGVSSVDDYSDALFAVICREFAFVLVGASCLHVSDQAFLEAVKEPCVGVDSGDFVHDGVLVLSEQSFLEHHYLADRLGSCAEYGSDEGGVEVPELLDGLDAEFCEHLGRPCGEDFRYLPGGQCGFVSHFLLLVSLGVSPL